MGKSKYLDHRVHVLQNQIKRYLHFSDNFNICLEEICIIVEKFDKKCVPLTLPQIIKLKALHMKIWRTPSSVVPYKPPPRRVKGLDEV